MPFEDDTELEDAVAMVNKKLLEDESDDNNNTEKTTPNIDNNMTENITKDNIVKSKVVRIKPYRTRREELWPERRYQQHDQHQRMNISTSTSPTLEES